jgi:hypothetical protein
MLCSAATGCPIHPFSFATRVVDRAGLDGGLKTSLTNACRLNSRDESSTSTVNMPTGERDDADGLAVVDDHRPEWSSRLAVCWR